MKLSIFPCCFYFWFFNIIKEMLLFYSLCCPCICVSSFGAFPVFPGSRPIPDFYSKIHAFYANIMHYLGFHAQYCAWCTVGGRGVPMWLGGVCSLVRGATWACSLTCQPDTRIRIPALLLLPQRAG